MKAAIFGVPPIGGERLEPLDRKRSIDHRARLRQRPDRAGRHHLQADVAERGGLRRAGGDGAAGRVRGPLLQQTVTRPAADDANLVEAAAGQFLERLEHRPVLEGQAFENRARVGDRRVGLRLAGHPAILGDGRRHVGRVQEERIVGIDERPERQPFVRSTGDQRIVGNIVPPRPPVKPAGLQQPQPADVLQQARGAADPALIGEVERERSRGDHGLIDLGAEERPGTRAEKRDVAGRRHRRHRRRRVVAGGHDHRGAIAQCRRARLQRADHRTGFNQGLQQTGRQPNLLQHARRPRSRSRIDELRRRRHGVLGGQHSRQPVVQQVGNGDQRACGINQVRCLPARRVQLIERVDRQELDAGDGIDPVAAHALEHRFHRAAGAPVAIVVRVLEQVAALADERVVDAPAVDADAIEAGPTVQLQRAPHLLPEMQDVPLQRPVLPYGFVQEPVDLPDAEHTAVQRAEHGPSAFGAEIEGQELRAHNLIVS